MMTMATSTVDRTTSWCSSLQQTISIPSSTSQSPTVSKLDERNNTNQSYHNLSVLRGIPTRIPPKTPPHDGVDALVDDDADASNATTTTTLPPPTLEGQPASSPYQSGLDAITAAIEQLQRRDIIKNINPNNLHHVISDTKRAELSAALAELAKNKPAPLQQEAAKPPETAPLLPITMDDRLPDDGNRPAERPTAELLPAEPPQTITTATPDQPPTATQALREFLERYPRSIECSDDDDDDHLHDETRRPLNLKATIKLQTKVVRTLNVMCVELSAKLDLILEKIQSNNISPSLIGLPNALPTHTSTQPAIILGQRMYPAASIQLWLQCHTNPRNKSVLVNKFTPYKKPIPAKPPFTRGRRHVVVNRTKDYMRPP